MSQAARKEERKEKPHLTHKPSQRFVAHLRQAIGLVALLRMSRLYTATRTFTLRKELYKEANEQPTFRTTKKGRTTSLTTLLYRSLRTLTSIIYRLLLRRSSNSRGSLKPWATFQIWGSIIKLLVLLGVGRECKVYKIPCNMLLLNNVRLWLRLWLRLRLPTVSIAYVLERLSIELVNLYSLYNLNSCNSCNLSKISNPSSTINLNSQIAEKD